jgi:hypothetical protein
MKHASSQNRYLSASFPSMTPAQIYRQMAGQHNERAACQEHFIDTKLPHLC